MSVYEELVTPEYWEGPQAEAVPELGWLATHVDVWYAGRTGTQVENNFYELKQGDIRAVLVEPDEELPALDPHRPGLVRIILDERRRRRANSTFPQPTPQEVDGFDTRARFMDEEHLCCVTPAKVTVPVLGTDEGYAISRSLLYARTSRSGGQLIAVPSASVDIVAEEEWGKLREPGARVIVPRLTVGRVYRDEVGGMPRERRVSHAEIITPLNPVKEKDRGVGGKKVYTLEWMRHQVGLASGRA